MKEIGWMTINMEKEYKFGRVAQNMQENLSMANSKEKDLIILQMKKIIKENVQIDK